MPYLSLDTPRGLQMYLHHVDEVGLLVEVVNLALITPGSALVMDNTLLKSLEKTVLDLERLLNPTISDPEDLSPEVQP